MNKDISDVLEYLYKQGKKDLALAVIKAINTQPPQISYYPQYQPQKPYEPFKYELPYWVTTGRQM